MELDFVFTIAILIMSVVIHEVSHGYVAQMFGDPTARLAGRLTLNPIKHLDPVGSFLVPVATYFLGGFIFGWARPVPYNPYNLSNQRWGTALVAAAGALSNLFIAIVFGLLIRFSDLLGIASEAFVDIASIIVFLNIILAVFNMIPVPPLDGSKVLFSLLPHHLNYIQDFLERYALILIFFLVLFLWRFVLPMVFFLFSLITGVGFSF
ncbi:MAG: site-2 protease family protein [Patescibacteria group bacterium]|nr:site-2 protease family protein [Patescibacteria group bacterium]